MRAVKAGSAEFRKLLRKLPPGYWLAATGGGHQKVMRPDGTPVRLDNGRILTIPGSPSCPNSITSTRAALQRAGLLPDGRGGG